MDLKLFYALLLTILPLSELRIGLPIAISYAIEQSIPIFFIFTLVILLNILVIFFIFYFLDYIHSWLMSFSFYRKNFEIFLKRFQRKVDKFEKKYESLGFFALVFFVAVPLPLTGAWSGCLVSWILGLDRKKSILSISAGVIISGIIILIGTLGFISLFSL
jgi:uncharacterized membrane protein